MEGHINLIKSDSKNMYNALTFYIYQRIFKKNYPGFLKYIKHHNCFQY